MIVLDTHALVWWVSDKRRLSATARRAIENSVESARQVCVSSISTWEIAMLVKRSRLVLTMDVHDWLFAVEQVEAIRFIPVDNRIAVRSTTLPEPFHKDPADRIIVATTQQLHGQLITADRKLIDYAHVHSIW